MIKRNQTRLSYSKSTIKHYLLSNGRFTVVTFPDTDNTPFVATCTHGHVVHFTVDQLFHFPTKPICTLCNLSVGLSIRNNNHREKSNNISNSDVIRHKPEDAERRFFNNEYEITEFDPDERSKSNRKLMDFSLLIRKRDNNQCQACRSQEELHAHHLLSWHSNEKTRYSLENGITLCHNCHRRFHKKYGNKNNTPEQFLEWIISVGAHAGTINRIKDQLVNLNNRQTELG